MFVCTVCVGGGGGERECVCVNAYARVRGFRACMCECVCSPYAPTKASCNTRAVLIQVVLLVAQLFCCYELLYVK